MNESIDERFGRGQLGARKHESAERTQTPDNRIAQRWAVDPLDIGCPFNVETEDGKRSICLTQQAWAKTATEQNENRAAIAARIVTEHNALLGIPAPEAALKEAREALAGLLADIDAGRMLTANRTEKARKALALLTPQEGAK